MSEVALINTDHKKIFIEKPIDYDIEFVRKSIEEFRKCVTMDKEDIMALMKSKVATYNPQNL